MPTVNVEWCIEVNSHFHISPSLGMDGIDDGIVQVTRIVPASVVDSYLVCNYTDPLESDPDCVDYINEACNGEWVEYVYLVKHDIYLKSPRETYIIPLCKFIQHISLW